LRADTPPRLAGEHFVQGERKQGLKGVSKRRKKKRSQWVKKDPEDRTEKSKNVKENERGGGGSRTRADGKKCRKKIFGGVRALKGNRKMDGKQKLGDALDALKTVRKKRKNSSKGAIFVAKEESI